MASMKNYVLFVTFGLLVVSYVYAESASNADDDENTIKVYKRLIPADVLRGKNN